MATHTLIYAPQCPNCVRLIGALDRTSMRNQVARVDVNTLSEAQMRSITAVPTIITPSGARLVGTRAFEWLKEFEGDMELDSYSCARGLAYSDVSSDQALATFAQPYSPFSPVP